MLLKIISLSLISCLYLQCFVVPLNQYTYKNDEYIETSDRPLYEYKGLQYELVASVPNKNIKLYAIESCNYSHQYNKFLLVINGRKRILKWEGLTDILPKMILRDVDNDNVKELIVILQTDSGTGLYKEEIHVINMENFYEYMIANPLIIIKEKVTSKIIKKEDHILVQMNLNNKKYNLKKRYSIPMAFDKVVFGNVIHWEVIDKKLYVRVPGQITPGGFIGDLVIQYKFNSENEFFNLDKITYEEKKMPLKI